jgi:predicted lipoprotein
MRPFLVALLLLTGATQAQAEADHAAIAQASLTEIIRPTYSALAETAGALTAKVEALCQQPSAGALRDARSAFADVVAAWSKAEIFRFGPANDELRYERLFFWPDPKGLGLRQIRDALAKQDQTVLEADELAGKSVALQGLPALEYLLFGNGAEILTVTTNPAPGAPPLQPIPDQAAFGCGFARAVATNVERIAEAIVEDWRDGSAYEKSFLGPAPDDPGYHDAKEVTLELFKVFTSGIELVRDQKLAKPLGASAEEAKPKLAAFWRSGLTFQNAAGNLEGVRALFAQGGFAPVVAAESAGVENSILFDLDHAIGVLRGIDLPMAEAAADENLRAKIEALRVALKSARDTAGDTISRGAGLSFGFNAMDGD